MVRHQSGEGSNVARVSGVGRDQDITTAVLLLGPDLPEKLRGGMARGKNVDGYVRA
jgi:hypothetical protein